MAQSTLRDRIQSIEDAISAGHIDTAMAECQQILAHYPDALEIQRLMGEVYLAQGRLEEAQQTFDWILVNDPENVIAYCDRALICEHHSDIDTALDCYQQAYELSRGNSQIRQEFNQLSARVGQQEFMMSRAGLARLYMRGDLLTQATQEWEAVLSNAPDRLDARLGLMETCWREGLYDQVEQMASHILEDIPNCEKALLLLAHTTSAFNIQRSRELVQRAELLDPELIMAQELFGDLAASQPNDPFLALIKRESTDMQEAVNGNGNGSGKHKQIDAINTNQYAAVEVEDATLVNQGASADRLYSWSAQDALSELDTRAIAQPGSEPPSDATSRATWSEDTTIASSNTRESQAAPKQPADDFDAWAAQQEIDDDYDPALLEQQPWFQAEQAAVSPVNEPARGDSQPGLPAAPDQWNAPSQPREENPAPPAWLEMLTKNERQQPDVVAPQPVLPAASVPVSQESALAAYAPQVEIVAAPAQSWEDELQTAHASPKIEQEEAPALFLPSDDNEEEDMGWPEWLKSLGAETIEPAAPVAQEEAAQPAYSAWSDLQQSVTSAPSNSSPFDGWLEQPQPASAAASNASQPADEIYDPWAERPEAGSFTAQEPARLSTWEEQIDHTMSEAEQEQLATLETLEQSLLSQGFVPLQPGALSSIAQESELAAASGVPVNFGTPPLENHVEPAWTPLPVEEPQWSKVPTAPLQAPAPELPVLASSEPATLPVTPLQQKELTPALATNHVEQIAPDVSLTPAYRVDALLESELETTMKRPAVRLQAMQTAVKRTDQATQAGKGRPTERVSGSRTDGNDGALSHKEQLLKGYQYQLAGAYDDAMQEYRITIRNAPEMLDEVISNLRALLKIAPRYTAGYRVLGDAYMRKGEYLQAMEAYNKALTMAKKAKSQSR